MREYLTAFIKQEESLLESNHIVDSDIEELKLKISYFQHERLIHLLVTLFFSFFAIIFMVLGMVSYYFLIIFGILLVFVVFYIYHYYFLEKKVQYLYKIYDRMREKVIL